MKRKTKPKTKAKSKGNGAFIEKPKHSPIGASSRYRWAQCPGSVKLSQDEPNISGPAAKEGSLAHEVLAGILNTAFSRNIPIKDAFVEYWKHLGLYLIYVQKLKDSCEIVHIEHAFDMSDTFDGLYGTADCVAYDKKNGILHVVDYKHGEGLVVEVKNNLQLEYYALGALTTLKYPCRYVQMTIVQPRAYHPDGSIRHWRVPSLHFLDVEQSIISEAEETRNPKAILHAGSHCLFCPAKKICPQKHTQDVATAKKEFSFYRDPKNDFEVIKA